MALRESPQKVARTAGNATAGRHEKAKTAAIPAQVLGEAVLEAIAT